MKAVEVCSYS